MKRSLVAGLGLLALARAAGVGGGSAARCDAVQGAGLCRAATTGPAFISASTAAAAGAIPSGTVSRSATDRRRHDRRHRRLQLAGPGQPVGVRPRRRHRLGQHQGQPCACGRSGLRDQEQLVRHRARPRRLRVRPHHALLSPAASRSATSKPTAPASRGIERHQRRLDHRRRHRGRASPATGRPRSSISMPISADTTLQRGRPAASATNVDLRLNILRGGLNYRF